MRPHRAHAEFRWIAKRYRTVVRERVDVGEQLRAILQGRDQSWGPLVLPDKPADRLLDDIRKGRLDEPPFIAATYRRLSEDERALLGELAERVAGHPAWPWLQTVRGVGPTLAAQLVVRLDRDRAPRPSSFWAFCGLATVAAGVWACSRCGSRMEVVEGRRVPRIQRVARDNPDKCLGVLVREGDAVRIAQGRAATPTFVAFDRAARTLCHLIGVSMLRTKGDYDSVYRSARLRFADAHLEWRPARIHASALRVMEKRFLLDLWHHWPSSIRDSADILFDDEKRWAGEGASPLTS